MFAIHFLYLSTYTKIRASKHFGGHIAEDILVSQDSVHLRVRDPTYSISPAICLSGFYVHKESDLGKFKLQGFQVLTRVSYIQLPATDGCACNQFRVVAFLAQLRNITVRCRRLILFTERSSDDVASVSTIFLPLLI